MLLKRPGPYLLKIGRVLREALLSSQQRRATLSLLRQAGSAWLAARDGELKAVGDMLALAEEGRSMRGVPQDAVHPTSATLRVIPAYEAAYRVAQLGFERTLWLVRNSPGGIATEAVLRDRAVKRLPRLLKEAANNLAGAFEKAAAIPRSARDSVAEPAAFVQELGQRAQDPEAAVTALLQRHKEVQEGKLDRGRRKSPWVVEDGGAYRLTFARVGGLDRPVTDPAGIAPHDYRLRNARRFIVALEIGA